MSTSIFDTFPTRPMRVVRHGIAHPFLMFLGVLMGFGIIAMVILSNAPGIVRDWEIAKDPVMLNQVRISNGKCTTRQLVFTDCKVTVTSSRAGVTRRQELEFAFFDIHTSSYSVNAIGSQSKPELITVDLALDKLWNRIITAGFLAAVGLAFVIGGLWAMARQMNVRRALRGFNGKVLRPLPVEMLEISKHFRKNIARYRFEVRGKKRTLGSVLGKQLPFYLDGTGANTTALGVTDSYGDYVLLLDDALERLDFTDAERQALRNARAPVPVQQPAFSPALAGIEPAR